MKFAICNELYQGWSLEAAFQHAAETGYTGIELAPFTLASDIRKLTETDCESIRKIAESAGLEIVGLHWLLAGTKDLHLTSPDPFVRNNTADYLKLLTRLCANLGGKVMVFGSPQQRNLRSGTPFEVGIERAAEVIQSLVPELETNEVTLAMEPLGPEEGNFLLTAGEAAQLIERVDSNRVQLHLDAKAMSTEGLPAAAIIEQHAAELVHFHANDPNRRGPGMGTLDFAPIMGALRKIDYQGWISVEVFDYSLGVDALARESFDYLQQFSQ